MVPAAFVDDTIDELRRRTSTPGDIIIDGGNSYYRDDIDRAARLEAEGHPLRRRRHQRRRVRPRARLLPHDRRRGRRRRPPRPDLRDDRARRRRRAAHARAAPVTRRPRRTATCTAGPNGAGHFVKMVHNGIEYGIMAAYAEGLNILHHADVGKREQQADAETAPLRDASTTSTTSTSRRSPRCGGAAASSRRGCSTSPPHALSQNHDLVRLRGPGVRLAARALDDPRRGRRRRSRPTCSARRSSRGSRRAAAPTSPTSSSPRCARSSAATTRSSTRRSARPSDVTDPSDALVFFGMSGDLAHKKIFPALYAMVKQGELRRPGDRRRVVAVDGRRPPEPRPRQHHRVRRWGRRRRRVRDAHRADAVRRRRLQRRRRRSRSCKKALGERAAPRALPRDPAEHVRDGGRGPRRRRAAPRTRA